MLTNRHILLTGGAGFIGSTITTALVERNRVRVFDTLDRNTLASLPIARHPNLEIIRGDVRDLDALTSAAADVDSVVHLASVAGVATVLNNPVRTMRVAIDGTANVLEACRRNGNIRRIVDFSTSEVFGRFAFNALESDATSIGPVGESRWTYAVAKIASEHLAHAYGREHNLPLVSLRPFNVYGPGQIGEGAIHNFIKRAINNDPIVVNNDGRQIRSWCFVDDMVAGTLLALEHPNAEAQVFNIGNPTATITVLRLAELIKRLAGSRSEIQFKRNDYPDVETRVPNIDKARDLLGFEPTVSLEDGIERTLAWYRQQMDSRA
jgi:nucleoside-diphosphate-sugar epimerase